ncbi:hypothetical protein EVAR_75332_1 [Eumeta japonica]|uniref:PDZ domain-containing protein n=1 Tax=Eumeta variegata TaxID=151549 RepID=A0A4C1XYN3_EUMVA|nr:hypothetical protein EVAR_75332_1 [Eumeta japonica]
MFLDYNILGFVKFGSVDVCNNEGGTVSSFISSTNCAAEAYFIAIRLVQIEEFVIRAFEIGAVTPGAPASRELVRGDIIAKIDAYDARDLRHEDAQNLFKNAPNQIKLVVQRGGASSHLYSLPRAGGCFVGRVPTPTFYHELAEGRKIVEWPPATGRRSVKLPLSVWIDGLQVCTVRTNCRCELPAHDAMRKFNVPRSFLLSPPRVSILRHRDAFVTNFTAAVSCAVPIPKEAPFSLNIQVILKIYEHVDITTPIHDVDTIESLYPGTWTVRAPAAHPPPRARPSPTPPHRHTGKVIKLACDNITQSYATTAPPTNCFAYIFRMSIGMSTAIGVLPKTRRSTLHNKSTKQKIDKLIKLHFAGEYLDVQRQLPENNEDHRAIKILENTNTTPSDGRFEMGKLETLKIFIALPFRSIDRSVNAADGYVYSFLSGIFKKINEKSPRGKVVVQRVQ